MDVTEGRIEDASRAEWLKTVSLKSGGHSPNDGKEVCLLEAVAYIAGEPFSDHPQCTDPVLGAFGRAVNDFMTEDERQQLVPLIPLLVGTAGDHTISLRRAMLICDGTVRQILPLAFEDIGLGDVAKTLRELEPVTNESAAYSAAESAESAASAAYSAAESAASAAYSAAYSAAESAAYSAAESAAYSAAASAAYSAAASAAYSAASAESAAYSAASAESAAYSAAASAAYSAASAESAAYSAASAARKSVVDALLAIFKAAIEIA